MAEKVVTGYEKDLRERIDERARPTQMHEGDMVYMYDPLARENKASKFSNRYTGPYRVVETKGDHLVKLVSLKTGKEISHLVNICKLKCARGPWSPALPNTIPKLVRDAPDSNSTGADPDQIPESHHTPTGKLAKRKSESRDAETESSTGQAGSPEHGSTPNTGEVPIKNRSERPAALQKTDGQHKIGQGTDTSPVSVPTPPPIAATGGQDAAGADGRGKRKRGRKKGKKQADTDLTPSAENTTIKQTGGDAQIATASHDPTKNKQRGQQGGYDLTMRLILIAQKTMMPTCKIPINQGVINIGTPTIPTNRSIKKAGGPTLHSKGRGPPQPRGPTSSVKCVTEKSHATRMPLLKRQRIRGGYQDPPPLSSRRLITMLSARLKS